MSAENKHGEKHGEKTAGGQCRDERGRPPKELSVAEHLREGANAVVRGRDRTNPAALAEGA